MKNLCYLLIASQNKHNNFSTGLIKLHFPLQRLKLKCRKNKGNGLEVRKRFLTAESNGPERLNPGIRDGNKFGLSIPGGPIQRRLNKAS